MLAHGGEIPNEAAEVLVGLAAWQARYISKRTREGPAAARAKGVTLGRPAENTGDAATRAVELRKQGMTVKGIAEALNAEGYRTARGCRFGNSAVFRMLERAAGASKKRPAGVRV